MLLFSKRKKLEEEYYNWLNKSREGGIVPKDCPFNVITFLDSNGYLKEDDRCEKSPTGEHYFMTTPDSFDQPYCKYCYKGS